MAADLFTRDFAKAARIFDGVLTSGQKRQHFAA